MLIKVDYRDAELHSKCCAILSSDTNKYNCIQIEKENIPLGDVIINDGNGKEKIIIERKSLTDLAASIRDGRYAEQSFRLNQCSLHNHSIYYAIEGDLRNYKPFNKGCVDKKTLLSAMVSISYFKGFSVHRTINIDETAEWIIQFALKLHKEGTTMHSFYNVVETNITEETEVITNTYSDVISNTRIKKNNITPENINTIMLSQIPGVSSVSADTIFEKFGSLQELIKALTESDSALDSISVLNKNGQSRKINKTCIANIYKYLIPNRTKEVIPI
jgi:ERCC4-type nuclease